jgi:hypothetical protein
VIPEPKKKPRSSYIRFAAEQPNECWQADFTHYRLTRPDNRPGTDCEILTWIDDCSRFALRVTAHHRVTGSIVLAEFRRAVATHGIPTSTLTDNGMVFTTRLSGGSLRGTRGRNGFEHELRRLGVVQKNSRPNHPTTSRAGRTLPTDHEELAPRPAAAADQHRRAPGPDRRPSSTSNHRRPHRSLPHRATPAAVSTSRPKATPGDRTADTHDRVRRDRVDVSGKITLRYQGRLYSIGIGRTHARTRVVLLVRDLDVRIIDAATGELLRELTLDPTKRHQQIPKKDPSR